MDSISVLAVIPAKGSSSRLHKKNVRLLSGKPLFCWTLKTALDSNEFSDVIVSSECEEILQIAGYHGAETKKRPNHLARDPVGCIDVAQHVVKEVENEGRNYSHIAILMPTCPFRRIQDIKNATTEIKKGSDGVIITVSEFSHTPFNGFTITPEETLKPILPKMFGNQTQSLPTVYRPNGAIFIMSRDVIMAAKNLFPSPMRPVKMPPLHSVDIDNELDLHWAEYLIEQGMVK